MSLTYDGKLVMPQNYFIIDDDEMEYLDGGGSFSRGWVATAVDVGAMFLCPYLAPIKYLGKSAAKELVKKFLPNLAGAFRSIMQFCLGISINFTTGKIGDLVFGNLWCLTSLGGVASLAADYFTDKRVDGLVSF